MKESFLNAIEQLCNKYIKYNNMNGYNNQKNYCIVFECNQKEDNINSYSIKVIQGIHYPKIIINETIKLKENISSDLNKIILNLSLNKYFSYTSFSQSYNESLKYKSFNLNYTNGVEIKFKIHTEEELKRYKIIKDLFNSNIVIKKEKSNDINKDDIQVRKADMKMDIAITIINLFRKPSNTYSNEYVIKLNNFFNKEKECYTYNLKIFKRNVIKEIFNMNFSIKNKQSIESSINKMLNEFDNENYIFSSISEEYNKNLLSIITDNNVNLEVEYTNEDSDKIYQEFKNYLDKQNIKRKTFKK